MKEGTGAVVVSLLLSGALACAKRDSASERPPASSGVESKPPAEPRAFRPPPDGKLTALQVERFIAVQKQTSALAAGLRLQDVKSAAATQLADLATADLRAAQNLGFDGDEYRWVKERVAEARVPGTGMKLDGLVKTLTAASVQGLESLRDRTEDPREKARLNEEIARLQSGPREAHDAGPRGGSEGTALAENRKLLERYRDQLDLLAPVNLPPVAIPAKSR